MAKKTKDKEPPAKASKPAKPKKADWPEDMAPATNDAYTGMLAISLAALLGAGALLLFDYLQYPDAKPPAIPRRPLVEEAAPVPDGGMKPPGGFPIPNPNPNPEGKEAPIPPPNEAPKEAPKEN